MTTNDQINAVIEQMLTERTFNLDIVEKVKAMRDAAVAKDSKIEELEKKLEEERASALRFYSLHKEASEKLEKLIEFEDSVIKREKDVENLKKDAQCSSEKVENIKWCFEMVFRNSGLRKSLLVSHVIPPNMNGNGGYMTQTNDSETSEEI